MKMTALSPRDSRIAAIILLLLALGLGYFVLLSQRTVHGAVKTTGSV